MLNRKKVLLNAVSHCLARTCAAQGGINPWAAKAYEIRTSMPLGSCCSLATCEAGEMLWQTYGLSIALRSLPWSYTRLQSPESPECQDPFLFALELCDSRSPNVSWSKSKQFFIDCQPLSPRKWTIAMAIMMIKNASENVCFCVIIKWIESHGAARGKCYPVLPRMWH